MLDSVTYMLAETSYKLKITLCAMKFVAYFTVFCGCGLYFMQKWHSLARPIAFFMVLPIVFPCVPGFILWYFMHKEVSGALTIYENRRASLEVARVKLWILITLFLCLGICAAIFFFLGGADCFSHLD